MTGEELLESVYVPLVTTRVDAIGALNPEHISRFVVAHNEADQISVLSDLPQSEPYSHLTTIASKRLRTCLRQALTFDYIAANHSLRSTLELHMAGIEFSVDEFKYRQWKLERRDVNWNAMVDKETGIFSTNFTFAFYPDLVEMMSTYRSVASALYSACSRYVHCNPSVAREEILSQEFNEEQFIKVIDRISTLRTITYFGFLMRFADTLTPESLLKIEEAVMDIFGHTAEIRKLYE